MSILDEIEQRERMSVVEVRAGSSAAQLNEDWRTVVRLARLAERMIEQGGPPSVDGLKEFTGAIKEIRAILRPKPPVKGAVVWLPAGSEYHVSGSVVWLGSGMTLEETQKGFSVQGERERSAKDAEIVKLQARNDNQKETIEMLQGVKGALETEMVSLKGALRASRGTYHDKEEVARLRGALDAIVHLVLGDTWGTASPTVMRIARDALRGGK